MGESSVPDLAGQEFLRRFEKIFGPIVLVHLKATMHYVYFGTDDIASIIQTRPELFERAMSEIFGKAWPAILKMTTADSSVPVSDVNEMNVGKRRHGALE